MTDIPLEALGLDKKWSRLAALQEEVSDLTRQAESAHAEVQRLEAALSVARNEDVAAQAQALRGGKAAPKASREDKANHELETARRNAAVFQRAAEDAQTELTGYRAKHSAALYRAVIEARDEVAREVGKHARAAATGFGKWSDLHYTLKDLTPPVEPDEDAPAVRSSMHFAGHVHTRQQGPARGEVEQMLAYLASLAPNEEEDTNAA